MIDTASASSALLLDCWVSTHTTFEAGAMRVAELADFAVGEPSHRFVAKGSCGAVSIVTPTNNNPGRGVMFQTNKQVAIKAMFNFAHDDKLRQTVLQKSKFDQEYQVALQHPHWSIVNVFNYFRSATVRLLLAPPEEPFDPSIFHPTTTYFTMEACRSDLERWLRDRSQSRRVDHRESSDAVAPRGGGGAQERGEQQENGLMAFDPSTEHRQALLVVLQLLHALDHLDRHRVRHLDIKLDNLFVIDARGGIEQRDVPQVVIGDFGTSKIGIDVVSLPVGQVLVGNAANRAPEVLFAPDNERINIKQCDKWSVGCVIFEMLEGRHPFIVRGDDVRTMARIRMGEIPRLSECWRAREGGGEHENRIKSALEEVVSRKLLVRDASRRGEAREMIESVERAVWPMEGVEDRDRVRWIKDQQCRLVAEIMAQQEAGFNNNNNEEEEQVPKMTIEQLMFAMMLLKRERQAALVQAGQLMATPRSSNQ